jgi:hypothetical protein
MIYAWINCSTYYLCINLFLSPSPRPSVVRLLSSPPVPRSVTERQKRGRGSVKPVCQARRPRVKRRVLILWHSHVFRLVELLIGSHICDNSSLVTLFKVQPIANCVLYIAYTNWVIEPLSWSSAMNLFN